MLFIKVCLDEDDMNIFNDESVNMKIFTIFHYIIIQTFMHLMRPVVIRVITKT